MSSKSLTVVAVMRAKAGKEAELKRETLALIPITRKEQGCINYDLHQDINDPALFVFHENWASKAHLDAHLANTHLQSFLGKAGDLLAQPPQIILCDKIG